jgi:ligand-binding SRPBCC domain-containing protein
VPRIVLTTRIPAAARECFDLSLAVDAHTASMSRSGETVVHGPDSAVLGPGDEVTWRARHFGIRFEMTSRITEHDPPRRFVDEQTSGPFTRWWHEHTFEQAGDATVMTDVVEFAAPLGPLGRLVETVFLTRYLTRLLASRNAWLREALS